MNRNRIPHVAVVGAGIAGLAAAAFAARGGTRVTLLESVSEPGGRARTRASGRFRFNMGPHALYRGGPAEAVLAELGIAPQGAPPDISRGLGFADGRLHVLPGGPLSLMTTTLLGAREKAALGAMLARLPRLDPTPYMSWTLEAFVRETFRTERLRSIFAALVRLSTYTHAPGAISAGTAIAQVQSGLGSGVLYLDRGWQPMVDAMAEVAQKAGVEIRVGARVRSIEEGGALEVVLREGERIAVDAVVLAMGPAEAHALVAGGNDPLLAEQVERALPVRAACLEIGLSQLPDPSRPFALGIDVPTYVSLHSASARGLAPEGGALFHAARYLAPDEKPDRAQVKAQLEGQLDALQPGWRDHVEEQTLLLDVPVAHAVPTAEMGGLAGRPCVDALAGRHPGVLLAGDWIGPRGWLADASFASGRDAGREAAVLARSGLHG